MRAASFPMGMAMSTMPMYTKIVHSLNVTTALGSSPASATILQVSASFACAALAKLKASEEGGVCSWGHEIQASKMASPRHHQGGKQQP
mmetsp:Transcript_26970/g.37897  ORF Transcript_26970/g.37897 Transcript_26970/m.37897 type:complete len:89 (+) Transcript_26970:320-586(+)